MLKSPKDGKSGMPQRQTPMWESRSPSGGAFATSKLRLASGAHPNPTRSIRFSLVGAIDLCSFWVAPGLNRLEQAMISRAEQRVLRAILRMPDRRYTEERKEPVLHDIYARIRLCTVDHISIIFASLKMFSSSAYLLALPFVASALADQACPRIPGIQIYATTPNEGLSDGRFTSCENGFDSPKVRAGNASSYDWWYFDAIGTDGVSSLAVTYFVEARQSGFTVTENFTNQDFVQISGTFPNGTAFSDFLFADNAMVSAMGDGSSGLWNGTGASWAGSPDLSNYLITLAGSHRGYEGTFSMHSVAPPHYPCSPKRANETMEVLPGVGWANSIPDADVTVNMTVHGSTLSFIGTGYHDKVPTTPPCNWGVIPFTDAVGGWYWGHARMGPYSLVWLDSLTPSKDEHTSGYVAYQGQILHAECNKMTVRPTGPDVHFPPRGDDSLPEGFTIEVDLGGELGVLKAELASNLATLAKPGYGRWIGTVNGTVGGLSYAGVAGYEMFNFF
ncbi:hypothetical protein AWENTII_005646 [Aspergillus wentii]